MMSEPSDRPAIYGAIAFEYLRAGWSPLPLPPGLKHPPPEGATGRTGIWLSGADVQELIDHVPVDANIGLRLPRNVIGIDVDAYGGKPGRENLIAKIDEWGDLPDTWISSSRLERGDYISGIRYFRIPEGLWWPNVVAPGIEVIRYAHRYAVAPPSIHPEGGTYKWVRPDGTPVIGEVPKADELPYLPDAWVAGLTQGKPEQDIAKAKEIDASIWGNWITDGVPCAQVIRDASKAQHPSASRHDTFAQVMLATMYLGQSGHYGVRSAMANLWAQWQDTVGKDRPHDYEAEWARLFGGAVEIIAAKPRRPEVCRGHECGLITKLEPPAALQGLSIYGPDGEVLKPAGEPAVEYDEFGNMVNVQLTRLKVNEAAKKLFALERLGPPPAMDFAGLEDILARPEEPPHRVKGLVPWNASTLVVAQRKTGKTTYCLNLCRSLITGQRFLGELDCQKLDGNIAFVNLEVNPRTVAQWAVDMGIPANRLFVYNGRGQRSPFSDDELMHDLAELFRPKDVETIIIDTFIQAFAGSGNDNAAADVAAWLNRLAQFVRHEVGAKDLILTTHAGWGEEARARGSSALEDWADAIHVIEKDEETGARFLKAFGRDIDMPQDELTMTSDRRLVLAHAGNRRESKAKRAQGQLAVDVLRLVTQMPGIGTNEIAREMGKRKESVQAALDLLLTNGAIKFEDGGNRKKLWRINPDSEMNDVR